MEFLFENVWEYNFSFKKCSINAYFVGEEKDFQNALKKELFEISAEEGAISNERDIKNKLNITNDILFQKFNKSETYLIKITYQTQDYRFYCCQLKF